MQANITQLRSHLYQWIDHVVATGEPIEINRHGTTVKIIRDKPKHQKKRVFEKREGFFIGDPESIVHMDWSSEWSAGRDLS